MDKPKSPIEKNFIEKFWFYPSLSVMYLLFVKDNSGIDAGKTGLGVFGFL